MQSISETNLAFGRRGKPLKDNWEDDSATGLCSLVSFYEYPTRNRTPDTSSLQTKNLSSWLFSLSRRDPLNIICMILAIHVFFLLLTLFSLSHAQAPISPFLFWSTSLFTHKFSKFWTFKRSLFVVLFLTCHAIPLSLFLSSSSANL